MSTTHTPNGGDAARRAGARPEERDTGNRQDSAQFAERARREAAGIGEAAKERAREAFDEQRQASATRVHDVAEAARSAAEDLERSSPDLARYTREAASYVDEFSDAIKNRSIGDLVRSVDQFARREPVAFFGTALAAGFAISRFLGSSAQAERERRFSDMDQRYSAGHDSPAYGSSTGAGSHASTTRSSVHGSTAYGAAGMANEASRHQDSGSGLRSTGSRTDGSGGIASGTAATPRHQSTGNTGGLSDAHGTAQPTHVQSPAGTPNLSSSSSSSASTSGSDASKGLSGRTAGSASDPSSSFSTSGGAQPPASSLKSGPAVPVTAKTDDAGIKNSIGTGKDPEAVNKLAAETNPKH